MKKWSYKNQNLKLSKNYLALVKEIENIIQHN